MPEVFVKGLRAAVVRICPFGEPQSAIRNRQARFAGRMEAAPSIPVLLDGMDESRALE
jgi:hypothetical protein